MRSTIGCIILLVPSLVSAAELVDAPRVGQAAPNAARRCAFNGSRGSFHFIGDQGTAAYKLGNEKFVASLVASGEDADYWYYVPTQNGDQFTTRWAFARQPNCDGYWVWRHDRSGWRRFEATDAWGDGLTRQTRVATSVNSIERLQFDVRDLQNRVRTLEQQRPVTP